MIQSRCTHRTLLLLLFLGTASNFPGRDEAYVDLIQRIPIEVNQRVLIHVLALLAEAAEARHSVTSKMTLPNLAIVFSPGLLRNPSNDPAAIMLANKHENAFVCELVARMRAAGYLSYSE